MLQGVNFIQRKFAHILVRPISPARNSFFIHMLSYENAHFWGAPPYCLSVLEIFWYLWYPGDPPRDAESLGRSLYLWGAVRPTTSWIDLVS